jgi:hypothetical protein
MLRFKGWKTAIPCTGRADLRKRLFYIFRDGVQVFECASAHSSKSFVAFIFIHSNALKITVMVEVIPVPLW